MNLKSLFGISGRPVSKEESREIVSAPQIQVARSWWQIVLVVVIFFVALTVPLIWLITNQALEAANTGKSLPGGWTWSTVIIFDVLILLGSLYLIWIPVKDMLTLFTERGIRQPIWFGLKHIYLKWAEVEHID